MALKTIHRHCFLIAILCHVTTGLLSQDTGTPAEIIIIGTIHTGNKKFNHKTLYKTLKEVKPDIILREQDKPYRRVFGLSLAHFLKIKKASIEKLSVQQYARQNKNCVILPYDTTIPNRRGYIKKWIAINNRFFRQLDTVSMSASDSTLYNSFKKINKAYYATVVRSTLAEINHAAFMDRTHHLYEVEKKQVLEMGKVYITDTAAVQDFEKIVLFWEKRNNYMAAQVVKIAKENPGKKILVLCGLNHKYYLTQSLQQAQLTLVDSYQILHKE